MKLCRRGTDEGSRSTYRDDVTRDETAHACMQNYDPAFDATARPGDILVSGYNFGTGETFLVLNHSINFRFLVVGYTEAMQATWHPHSPLRIPPTANPAWTRLVP